jgi:hypothetical protein
MMRFIAAVFVTIALFGVAQAAILLGIAAPVPAEYWIPQMISVKEGLLAELNSPRIVFLGGSTTLFGIDAGRVSAALHVDAMNMGLHGALRLDRFMMLARGNVKRGDILVMPLEPLYYECSSQFWMFWQLRNSVAWDRADYFDRLPLSERIVAAWTGGDLALLMDVLIAKLESRFEKAKLKERIEILNPTVPPLTLFKAQKPSHEFSYSAFNLDTRGDMLNTIGAHYFGAPSDPSEPGAICPAVAERLKVFNQDMEARGVRLFLAHTPYLVEGVNTERVQSAERAFAMSVRDTGLTILDRRDEMMFSRQDFFNTNTHLNSEARELRTDRLIAHLNPYVLSGQPSWAINQTADLQ